MMFLPPVQRWFPPVQGHLVEMAEEAGGSRRKGGHGRQGAAGTGLLRACPTATHGRLQLTFSCCYAVRPSKACLPKSKRGPGIRSHSEEEDDPTEGLSAKVLDGMPNAQDVQGMLRDTDPTGSAGGHVADGRPEQRQPARMDSSIESVNPSDKGMQMQQISARKPSPCKRKARDIHSMEDSGSIEPELAHRRMNSLSRVLAALRRKSASILLERGFQALDKKRSEQGASAAWSQQRTELREVVDKYKWDLGSICSGGSHRATMSGKVQRLLDTLVGALGTPAQQDTEIEASRTITQWRHIHTALLPNSSFMVSVQQATAVHVQQLLGPGTPAPSGAAPAHDISVGEYLDWFAGLAPHPQFAADALYVSNVVLPAPTRRAFDKKRLKLQRIINITMEKLRNLDRAENFVYGFVVKPPAGHSTLLGPGAQFLNASEPVLSEVHSVPMLLPARRPCCHTCQLPHTFQFRLLCLKHASSFLDSVNTCLQYGERKLLEQAHALEGGGSQSAQDSFGAGKPPRKQRQPVFPRRVKNDTNNPLVALQSDDHEEDVWTQDGVYNPDHGDEKDPVLTATLQAVLELAGTISMDLSAGVQHPWTISIADVVYSLLPSHQCLFTFCDKAGWRLSRIVRNKVVRSCILIELAKHIRSGYLPLFPKPATWCQESTTTSQWSSRLAGDLSIRMSDQGSGGDLAIFPWLGEHATDELPVYSPWPCKIPSDSDFHAACSSRCRAESKKASVKPQTKAPDSSEHHTTVTLSDPLPQDDLHTFDWGRRPDPRDEADQHVMLALSQVQ